MPTPAHDELPRSLKDRDKSAPEQPVGEYATGSAVGTLPAEQMQPVDGQFTDLAMWAVVFAGGIGSRFWPLSTPARPKPLLALVTGHSLLEQG